MLVRAEVRCAEPRREDGDDLGFPLPFDLRDRGEAGRDPRRDGGPGARETPSRGDSAHAPRGRERRLSPDEAEVDARFGDARLAKSAHRLVESLAAREEARPSQPARGEERGDPQREARREAGVVGVQDEARHGASRRRSPRSVGTRRARSRRMRRIVRGDESVETPRVRGK